ncbi:MAG: hypothetical protein M3R48_06820 [Candidatus Dormibacteraeota bacterium]|nr:hypothetical protein [Candidatus Dormibacteraeota bacterium]
MSARLRRHSSIDIPRRKGAAAALRRWTIPTIGALTPVGLIVVNIAVFIVKHLDQFRWTISVLAFVSGLMLNSWTALKIYRVAKSRFPNAGMLHDRNQEVVLVIGIAVIAAISFVEALFCYNGLSNAANLPNAATFILGIVAVAIPIVLQGLFGRLLRDRAHDGDGRVHDYPLPPPPPDRRAP